MFKNLCFYWVSKENKYFMKNESNFEDETAPFYVVYYM